MGKNKYFSWWIVRPVVLMLLVWFFAGRGKKDLLPREGASQVYVEADLDKKESNLKEVALEAPPKKPKTVLNVTLPQTKTSAIKALQDVKETRTAPNFFQTQRPDVYFKVQGGLALMGGDMILGSVSKSLNSKGTYKNSRPLSATQFWSDGEVPYGFASNFPHHLKLKVKEAIEYMNQETSVRFFPMEVGVDQDAVVFSERNDVPCSSNLGKIGGLQPIYLNAKCSRQDVLHEMMHALGFVHEQMRSTRDEVLEILWSNIKPGQAVNFQKMPDAFEGFYQGRPFELELGSIMMYHDRAFSKDGLALTMKSKTGESISPVQNGLSDTDKERIELVYGR